MKQDKEKSAGNKSVLLAFLTAFIFIGLYFGYTIFSVDREYYNDTPFLNVEGIWADSVTNLLSAEEKVAQWFIKDLSLLSEDHIYKGIATASHTGGMAYQFDSIKKYRIAGALATRHETLPLIRMFPEYYPSSLSERRAVPAFDAIDCITNDSLLRSHMLYLIELAEECHTDLSVLPQHDAEVFLQNITDTAFVSKQLLVSKYFIYLCNQRQRLATIRIPSALFKNSNISVNDSLFLEYYKTLLGYGVSAIITDTFPESMHSRDALKNFLIEKLHFRGLVLYNGELGNANKTKTMFLSGIDQVITSVATEKVIKDIASSFLEHKRLKTLLHHKTKRILLAKEWLFFTKPAQQILSHRFTGDLKIRQHLYDLERETIILVNDKNRLLPVATLNAKKIRIWTPKNTNINAFTTNLSYFADFEKSEYADFKDITPQKTAVNIILATQKPDSSFITMHNKASFLADAIVLHFGKLSDLRYWLAAPQLVHFNSFSDIQLQNAVNIIIGGISATGILPYRIGDKERGTGITDRGIIRLSISRPEETGILTEDLSRIDSIVNRAMLNATFPGCQVFIAKRGKVIYHKAFGYHTYEKQNKVKWSDIYDLASVTKTAATTLAFMKMYEQGKMALNDKLGKFFKNTRIEYHRIKPDTIIMHDTIVLKMNKKEREKKLALHDQWLQLTDTTFLVSDTVIVKLTPKNNIFQITMRQLLLHESGLSAAMPIYRFLSYYDRIKRINNYNNYYSSRQIRDSATIRIAKGMYLYNHYFDTLWRDTKEMRVNAAQGYLYSDANLCLVQIAIDSINKLTLDEYLQKELFIPLELRTIGFLPLNRFPKERLIPTQNDINWRRQLVHGDVHDPTAALLGGIAGNAGLFSNAFDLGTLYQMLLNGGEYGNKHFFKPETVKEFTTRQSGSRGYGFAVKSGNNATVAPSAPKTTYGHIGFTGTAVWVDPENELVYVFLSNRVHPNSRNTKINVFKVRENVHQVVYDAIAKGENEISTYNK